MRRAERGRDGPAAGFVAVDSVLHREAVLGEVSRRFAEDDPLRLGRVALRRGSYAELVQDEVAVGGAPGAARWQAAVGENFQANGRDACQLGAGRDRVLLGRWILAGCQN